MLTGIIEATAAVKKLSEGKLVIGRPEAFDDVAVGSSICVSGACLTVVAFDGETLVFDVMRETFVRTKFGSLAEGAPVNLERAMRMGDRFEGHMVQGHVEGVGRVIRRMQNELVVEIPHDLLLYVAPKGSITLDGVSLTVAKINGNECTAALIPHTLERTTLGALRKGDPVNMETDVLVRHAVLHRSQRRVGARGSCTR